MILFDKMYDIWFNQPSYNSQVLSSGCATQRPRSVIIIRWTLQGSNDDKLTQVQVTAWWRQVCVIILYH